MTKFDVEAVYRNVPIHPEDRFLLGMRWRDQFYVDLVLPFGLRSAPFLFDAVYQQQPPSDPATALPRRLSHYAPQAPPYVSPTFPSPLMFPSALHVFHFT